jgi:hypothetical protein
VGKVAAPGVVRAVNPVGEPDGKDPRERAMSPGMRQEVHCRKNPEDRRLWWYWAWSGPLRSSPPELEPLCPAAEAERAADRIAKVLELRPDTTGASDGSSGRGV